MVKFEDPGINGSQFLPMTPCEHKVRPLIGEPVSELSVIPEKKNEGPMADHIGFYKLYNK